MVHLSTCWTPCFWHSNVRHGSFAVAVYTIFMSILLIVYTAYVMGGGDSSQLWLPYFETNVKNTMIGVGGFVIAYFILLIIMSILMIFGVGTEIRGFMLPWFVMMVIIILFQTMYGLWLVFGYYIYLEMFFAAIIDWFWMSLNIYCMLVVRSHYRNLTYMQSPEIHFYDTW